LPSRSGAGVGSTDDGLAEGPQREHADAQRRDPEGMVMIRTKQIRPATA